MMNKRYADSVSITALIIAACILPTGTLAQDRLAVPTGLRAEKGRVGQAIVLLRRSIAEGRVAELKDHIAPLYTENGVVYGREQALALFTELSGRAAVRDSTERHPNRGFGSRSTVLRTPLWDFDLARVQISVTPGALTASVSCRALLHVLPADTTLAGQRRREAMDRDITLEFERGKGPWRLVRSDGLFRFLSEAVALIEQRAALRGEP